MLFPFFQFPAGAATSTTIIAGDAAVFHHFIVVAAAAIAFANAHPYNFQWNSFSSAMH